MTDFLNALVIIANFILVPGLAYGSQLALGALGVTLIYGILRFSNLSCNSMHVCFQIQMLCVLARASSFRARINL